MKHFTFSLTIALFLASNVAFAEAGVPLDGQAPQEDAGADGGVPLACDGALCDTTNGGTCDVAPNGLPALGLGGVFALALGLSAVVMGVARRRSSGRDVKEARR